MPSNSHSMLTAKLRLRHNLIANRLCKAILEDGIIGGIPLMGTLCKE